MIAEYKVPADQISVIPNGLVFGPDLTAPKSPRKEIRQKLGAAPDDVVLLDVAMFRPEKNQRALIDMAARLDPALPWRLWLAGDGATLAKCKRHAKELGLAKRVTFLGLRKDPRPLYQAADIAVHASSRESLSNFLIEAQAHGLPAVASAARGVDETFVDEVSGFLIEPDDLPAFATAVTGLLNDQELRQTMGSQARQHAEANFSTAAQIKAHLDLFTKLSSLRAS